MLVLTFSYILPALVMSKSLPTAETPTLSNPVNKVAVRRSAVMGMPEMVQ